MTDKANFSGPLKPRVAIINQKGGVGKTTTAVNMASYLASLGYRTLLVDADAQANSTISFGINSNDLESTFYNFLVSDTPFDQVIRHTMIKQLDIIPSNDNLYAADLDLAQLDDMNHFDILHRKLDACSREYEFTIIDSPPHLGPLTLNIMRASDAILVPLKADFLALQGLAILYKTFLRVKNSIHPKLCFLGILITMFSSSQKLCKDAEAHIKEAFGDLVFENKIPQNVTIAESPGFNKPVMLHGPKSQGALQYKAFTLEFLRKIYGAIENAQ
ncbi:MAG: AAA family ATPase [Deltaproteobacteria bacterium]|jgi:chromosome partitioning protein|nr:AAA family ATPase [Deltaproteobacteria bacterium]